MRIRREIAAIAVGLVLAALVVCTPVAGTQTRQGGRGLQLASAEWPTGAKRWALLIGVDDYQDSQITKLRGAARDAETLGDALVTFAGFPREQVIVLSSTAPVERQPTRVNILRRLSNLASAVPSDGLLLVSFSGHGIERAGQAFLLPTDAQVSDDVSLLEETAVSVARMRDRIRMTKVGQVVILLDACRNDPTSGRADTLNPLSKTFTRDLDFNVANRDVQAFATIYATGVGQRAFEFAEKRQGYFTWALVEGLKGAAADDAGRVTLGRLVRYVQETVARQVSIDLGAGKEQRPFATIEGYRAEDLVVATGAAGPRGRDDTPPGGGGGGGASVELAYWDSIKTSTDPDDFAAYLKKYPNGDFADLARNRLRRLERPAAPVTFDLVAAAGQGENPEVRVGDVVIRTLSGRSTCGQVGRINLVMPPGVGRFMCFFGPGFNSPSGYHAVELEIVGATATSVTVTRPGGREHTTTPAWQMQAYDARGQMIGATIGEGDVTRGGYVYADGPQEFTIATAGIKRLRIGSNNTTASFNAVPFARFMITLAPSE